MPTAAASAINAANLALACPVQVYQQYLEYYWSATQGVLDLDSPGTLSTPRNGTNLVLRPNVLQSGEVYQFRLTVKNNYSQYSGPMSATAPFQRSPFSVKDH